MKRALLMVIAAAIFTSTFAENWATSEGSCFAKGDMNASAGLSIGYLGVYATYDYAFHDAISGGVCAGFNGYSNTFYMGESYRVNYLPIGIRALFHPFNLTVLADKISIRDKLDVFGGLFMGYNIGWYRYSGLYSNYITSSSYSHFTVRENFGARFYPTSKLYLFAEEFGGYSAFGVINFGVGLKL